MSATAEVARGFGQGSDTTTVLTDKAKNITVIADEPFFSRHSRTHAAVARHVKGTRPMHRSTLTLEVCPTQPSHISCMKMSYSGDKNLRPSRRPPPFPSQHTSQINIGMTPHQYFTTHSRETYCHHAIKPYYEAHEDNKRWNNQMAGRQMIQATRQEDSPVMSFLTTYGKIHNKLGEERGPGVQRFSSPSEHYDIITGQPSPVRHSDFHLTSGNRVLHSIRQSPTSQRLLLG